MNGFASLLELLGSALVAVLLTAAGIFLENAGIADVLAGPSVFSLWELGMGLLLLYTGVYMLGYRRVWLGLREALAA